MKRIPDWKEKCILLAILAAGVVAMWLLKLPCPWKAGLGVPCPGCGMTRSWVSVLKLDLAGAFQLHPMFWSVPVLVIWWFFDGRAFSSRLWNTLTPAAIGSGFLINWILRLLDFY